MKVQATALAILTAFSFASAESSKPRRNLRRGDKFKTKAKSRNAQSIFFPAVSTTPPRPEMKNVVFLLIDDVSTERFPETGNEALAGKLPGLTELKADGGVFYPHFYSSSAICAPAQSGFFAGMEPGSLGSHQQFAADENPGKESYKVVPPPEVQFIPEYLRGKGYYATGGGKLDYQVADFIPTFYNKVLGGTFTNINSYMEQAWTPAVEMGRPFFTMLNMMDNHEQISALSRENPIVLTDSLTGEQPTDLPFGGMGYATDKSLNFQLKVGEEPVQMATGHVNGFWSWDIDITGYNGDYDETTLTHANNGLPSYVPEEIGMQSLWAREYDLLRNVDWRIGQIIKRLKEEDLYDDTAIFIFGDHGSAHYKGKTMIQPQTTNTPLWVKLPKDVPVSPSVGEGIDGYPSDDRLMPMIDAFPTLVSILGIEPEPWMEGVARAGMFEVVGFEYDQIFSMVAREVQVQGWKSFAAYNKEFYFQKHTLNMEAIEAREAEGEDPAVIADAMSDALYANRYSGFRSPTFARLIRLMYINAENAVYPSAYRFLTASDARPPPEVLFDMRTDPYGTTNLLREYIYTPVYGTTLQSWGNFVTEINLSYGPVDLSRLDDYQLENYNKLRDALEEWVDGLKYVTSELDWSEALYGEENKMARQFWPDGTYPVTADPTVDAETGEIMSETEGSVFQVAVMNAEDRAQYEFFGPDAKDEIEFMSPLNSGMTAESYTSVRNGRDYMGFLYDGDALGATTFLGAAAGCTVFIAEDGTFMELICPTWDPFVFDTRDGVWNDETQTWDGVDPDTGEWIDEPVTVWDEEEMEWNMDVLSLPYLLGPNRDAIYTGLNADGSVFVHQNPHDAPLNRAGKPAPFYWGTDEAVDVLPTKFFPDVGFMFKGWHIGSGEFEAEDSDPALNTNLKGSYELSVMTRFSSLSRIAPMDFAFDSFCFSCILFDVDTMADLDFSEDDTLYVFTQGVRKGYQDSAIREYVFEAP